MTSEELKEMLEKFDFRLGKYDGGWYVFFKNGSVVHFYHEDSKIFLKNEFFEMPNTKKAVVLKALAMYIEELPEKKYKYKAPTFLGNGDQVYLARAIKEGCFFLGYGVPSDEDFQARFTDEEVEDLIEEHGDNFRKFIEICEKVEVE